MTGRAGGDGRIEAAVLFSVRRDCATVALSVRGEVEYGKAEWTLVVGEGIVHDGIG